MSDSAQFAPGSWEEGVVRTFQHAYERAAKSVLRTKRNRTAKRLRFLRQWGTGLERSYTAIEAQLAEARAILAPLLAEPDWYEYVYGEGSDYRVCIFCRAFDIDGHKPDCPVLRRDALLGGTQ